MQNEQRPDLLHAASDLACLRSRGQLALHEQCTPSFVADAPHPACALATIPLGSLPLKCGEESDVKGRGMRRPILKPLCVPHKLPYHSQFGKLVITKPATIHYESRASLIKG